MTTVAAPTAPAPPRPTYPVREPWLSRRLNQLLVVLGVWVVLYLLLEGKWTFQDGQPTTAVQDRLQTLRDNVDQARLTNPFFVHFINPIRDFLDNLILNFGTWLHSIGWLGPTLLMGAIGLVFASWRIMLLGIIGFLAFGVLGLFYESMDTLTLVVIAVVLSVAIGLVVGVVCALSDPLNRFITPILDFMQIMPTFAYLPLITLVFLIGPAAALVVTMIYAVPPVIRLTAAGIRTVSSTSVESATAQGSTRMQLLSKVQLPMARRTIVLGINQTTMAALSMITIAALIDAPGLGQVVLQAIEKLNVGVAFNGGLAIVVMAIVLDRTTTAVSERGDRIRRSGRPQNRMMRAGTIAIAVVMAVFGIVEGQTYVWANTFPESWVHPVSDWVNTAVNWITTNSYTVTNDIKNFCTSWFIDPLQNLLTNSPWFLVLMAVVAMAVVTAGVRIAITAGLCLAGCIALGLWNPSMVTLASVVVAAVATMVLGTLLGVWAGRSSRVEGTMRPVLDAGQVMPAFVYLPPALALFGVGRFTGVIAAVIYAAPAVVKVVIEGIHGVSATSIEAAQSSGSDRWQVIRKVQLPMSRPHLLLAFNQGVIYVLAMVVVGGLVGSQGLGLVVVQGFSQGTQFGRGLAGGIAIVLLGIMLDRITQGAGRVRRSAV